MSSQNFKEIIVVKIIKLTKIVTNEITQIYKQNDINNPILKEPKYKQNIANFRRLEDQLQEFRAKLAINTKFQALLTSLVAKSRLKSVFHVEVWDLHLQDYKPVVREWNFHDGNSFILKLKVSAVYLNIADVLEAKRDKEPDEDV